MQISDWLSSFGQNHLLAASCAPRVAAEFDEAANRPGVAPMAVVVLDEVVGRTPAS